MLVHCSEITILERLNNQHPFCQGQFKVSERNESFPDSGVEARPACIRDQLLVDALACHTSSAERAGNVATDFGHALVYAGLQSPVTGVLQLVDRASNTSLAERCTLISPPERRPFGSPEWHAQQIGGALGVVAPFLLAARTTRGAMNACGLPISRAEGAVGLNWLRSNRASTAIGESLITGFGFDFVARPVRPEDGDFWSARLKNGTVGALTFGALSSGSIGLRQMAGNSLSAMTGARRVVSEVAIGASAGVPAGLIGADARSLLFNQKFASFDDRIQNAYSMAFVGGTLSAFQQLPEQRNLSDRTVRRDRDGSDQLTATDRTRTTTDRPRIEMRTLTEVPEITRLQEIADQLPGLHANLRRWHRSGGQIRVATIGDEPVGFVAYGRPDRFLNEVLVAYVGVDPHYQGMGIGRQLMESVINEPHPGAHFVGLTVRVSNSKAISLYESLGFREVSRMREYYGRPREDGISMMRELFEGGWQRYQERKAALEAAKPSESTSRNDSR